MKLGEFTKLAKNYKYRPGYSLMVLKHLANYIGAYKESFIVADIGAGTGKLTENLTQLGMKGFAVEPNDAMREEGIRAFENINNFTWSKGTAEETGLETSCADWVFMGSSFHWTNQQEALREFNRILKPNGFFTAIYNPRDIEKSELHMNIENNIKKIVPELKRVSSGHKNNIDNLEKVLVESEDFHNFIFIEAPHKVVMSKERYLGAWESVNDIQVQAGPERFKKIMEMIKSEIHHLDFVEVPYKTRSWTAQKRR